MVPLHVLRIPLFVLFFVTVRGHCVIPQVRREWRSITASERASWIKAVTCLAKLPHNPKIAATVDPALSLIPSISPNSSSFDDFSYAHMDLNVLIHYTGYFFPWHRMFVQTFEDELRSKCGYDGVHPYWDWTKDTSDFQHASIFSDSTFDGLGAFGDPNNDFQISTGGFKDITVAYPVPHHIRRNYTLQPFINGVFDGLPPGETESRTLMLNTTFTQEVVDSIVNSYAGDYIGFQATAQTLSGPHPGPHRILGGEMAGKCPYGLVPPACHPGPKWSPNDPMFFLHHAMIDKLWYDWQHRNSRNQDAFGGGSVSWQVNSSLTLTLYPSGAPPWLNKSSVIPGDGLWEDVRVCDVMSTVCGKLCYIYA